MLKNYCGAMTFMSVLDRPTPFVHVHPLALKPYGVA